VKESDRNSIKIYKMSTLAAISSVMSSQISDSLTKVNYLMSQVEDSMSAIINPAEFLPSISDLLLKMQNIVSISQLSPATSINEDLSQSDASDSDGDSSISSFSSNSYSNQVKFIDKVLTFMSKVAPKNVFSRRKSKRRKARKLRRLLHPELFNIWYYSGQLVAPTDVSKKPVSSPPYPEVDWSNVNKRFLTNVPTPVQYPVYGCSESADFYEEKMEMSTYGYVTNEGSAFTRTDNPFGSLPGYKTIYGVVSVPSSQVFHGYTWLDREGWVLHASMPSSKGTRRERTKRGRRKK